MLSCPLLFCQRISGWSAGQHQSLRLRVGRGREEVCGPERDKEKSQGRVKGKSERGGGGCGCGGSAGGGGDGGGFGLAWAWPVPGAFEGVPTPAVRTRGACLVSRKTFMRYE